MSDILSGGAIDESTSGPIPLKADDRQRDVLEEQRIRQEQEAIGGTQFPPTPEPLPPISEPPQVAPPPLPNIDIPSLGIDFGQSAEAQREVARQAAIDVLKRVTIDGQSPIIEGSSISFNTSRRSVASEDFGTGGNANFAQPAFSQGRLEAADFGSRAAMEDRSSANAYAAAEARTDERRMSDPSFDAESPIRQRGETITEFRERQEQIREEASLKKIEAPDVLDSESVLTRDISGPIAVSLNRADGQGKVFAFLRSENSSLGEPTLPPSEYYVGGGDGATTTCNSLGLYFKINDNNDKELWITGGIVNGTAITEQTLASDGSGYVFARTTINRSTGALVDSSIITGTAPIVDTFTEFYFIIGFYNFDTNFIQQLHCGSLHGYSCRQWFVNPPIFQFRYH